MARLKLELVDSRYRWLLGSICDKERMLRAMENVDVVIHCAAQKHVDLGEYNPFHCVNVNVLATQTCIDAALMCNVDKFLYISSDKAVQPVSTYGRCKALSESLIIDAKNYVGDKRTKLSLARPPNYLNSDGSVFEIWEYQKNHGLPLTLTHKDMRRYFMDFQEIVAFIMKCVRLMEGGEIFIPYCTKETMIIDLAREISSNIQITGLRKGEKIAELLMDPNEESKAQLVEDIWVIKP